MLHETPAAPAVREMLERVLRSPTFARSERARDLLNYLIDRDLAGEAGSLKGTAIAMDVFGKDSRFDPSTDAVVRVQARRLRDLLDQYYATEGRSEPIRIQVPLGSYAPVYKHCDRETRAGSSAGVGNVAATPADGAPSVADVSAALQRPAVWEAPSLTPQLARHVHMLWLTMAVVVALLVFLIVRVALPGHAGAGVSVADDPLATGSVPGLDMIEALPAVRITVSEGDTAAARLASAFRAGLSGFDTLDLIVGDPASLAVDRTGRGMHFVFAIISLPAAGEVVVELQHVATGKVLMSREFVPLSASPEELHDQVADMLSTAAPASGVIYAFIQQNHLQFGLSECLLLNDDYYLDQTADNHRAAVDCFERLKEGGAESPLVYSELSALYLEAVFDHYDYPAGVSTEQARDLAYRAVLMGPASAYAHRAYGFMSLRAAHDADAIRWMHKAYELNTYDLSMAAAYAYVLIYSGDYATGTPLMLRAVDASSSHPSWWDYSLFLGEFMLGNNVQAIRATEALASGKRPRYLAARVIAAHLSGDQALSAKLLNELTETYPDFAKDPRAVFEQSNYPEGLTTRLIETLNAAGLDRSS